MSTAYRRHAVHVHRYRHYDLCRRSNSGGHAHFRFTVATWLVAMVMVGGSGGLDSLPLGAAVLKPDLDLELRETQLESYLWTLGQRQILLAVKLTLQLRQLEQHKSHKPCYFIAYTPITSICCGSMLGCSPTRSDLRSRDRAFNSRYDRYQVVIIYLEASRFTTTNTQPTQPSIPPSE